VDGILAVAKAALETPELTHDARTATMRIVRSARRTAALFALAGIFAPSVSAAIAVLHLSAHHPAEAHGEHHEHAADLSLLWHGHGHEATTPDHDHPALVAGMQGTPIPAVDAVVHAPSLPWRSAVAVTATGSRVWRSWPPGRAGLGPPPLPGRLSILRI
jgi:hypothetical protein